MERSDGSDKMAIFKEVCCSLLMLILGLLFCLPIAALVYFYFQSTAEGVTSCSLWVDIPGRIVIFMTCYYLASMCGVFPLSQRYHLSNFIVPFNVWRLKSWRRLLRNLCFPTRRLINRLLSSASPIRNSLETPLLQENNEERFRDNFQRTGQSEPIDIRYPKSYVAPVFVSDPEITPRNESPEVNKSSDGSITSISSSMGVFADQITKGKSSNRYCTSDASIEESPDDRVRVSSKYRKRYSEINWMGEAAANAPLPVRYDHSILDQRPAMPTENYKSAALTDDERLKISKKERRRPAREVPQVHMNEPVLVPRLYNHDYTLPHDESEQLLEQKSVPLNEDEVIVAKRDSEISLEHEMVKAHAADEQFRLPTSTAELFPKTNNQPRMHGRIKHPEGITVNYRIKSPPKYHEIYTETKNANVLTRVDNDHVHVTSEQPLDDKYFEPVDDERHTTSRQQEPTRSRSERLHLPAADGQIKVPTEKKLSTETKIESKLHRRNPQPGWTTATNEQGARPKLRNTETHGNFPGIRDRNQQPGSAIANPATETKIDSTLHRRNPQSGWATATNEQGAPPKLRNTEIHGNFPGIRDRNQQPGSAIANPATETKIDSTLHRRNPQPGRGSSANEQGARPKLRNTETHVNFPEIPDRNQQLGGAIANPATETKIESTLHRRNPQPGGATATNEQGTGPKLCNTEAQMNFSGIRDRKEQPGGAIANPANVRNTVTPRIPWIGLRNPRGLSALARKLHERNLELEKREIERYYRRQRNQTDLDRLVKEIAENLRSVRITQMQLPISSENISLIPRGSFQMRDFSTKCPDGQAVRHKTGKGIVKDKIDLTKNRYKVTEKQEVENMEKSHATNQGPPFFVQRSGLTQKPYLERSNAAEDTTSHRLHPSQSFQGTAEDKTDFKLEIHRRDDSGQTTLAEGGPSNLSRFEQDVERTGTLRPVTVESANESFNRLQMEGLRRRHLSSEQRTQTNTEAFVTVESKPNTDVNKESKISTKPSEVEKPDVTISIDSSSSGKSDSESGSEQSKK